MYKIKLSPFLRDLLTTSLTSFAVTISLIFVTGLLAKGLGPEEFGAYSLARRFIANVAPLILLSMGVSLRRYVAMCGQKSMQGTYIITSLVAIGCILFVFTGVSLIAGKQLCYIIFQDNAYLGLYYASLLFIGCYCLWVITSSSLFGMQKIKRVNLLQFIIGAVLPLSIAYLFAETKTAIDIIIFIGVSHLICLFVLIPEIMKTRGLSFRNIKKSFVTLFKYGIPRTPGDFAFAGLFSIGPFLAAHFGSLKDAGFFVIGQYVFRVMEAGITAFGQVALPKIAQLLSLGNDGYLKTNIENLMIMIFQLGLFVTIHTFLWVGEIVYIWLGSDYLEAVPIMKILILSVAPYLGYVMLRSVVDAIEVRAINTLNLFISLGFSVVISIGLQYYGLGMIGLAIGSSCGFALLGGLTASYLVRRYKISFKNFFILKIVLINILLALGVILFKEYLFCFLGRYGVMISWLFLEGFVVCLYLYYLYKNEAAWMLGIKRRMVRG